MNRAGWTQLEVLMVATLVGIMAAQTAPHFNTAIEGARVDYCVTQLNGISLGQRMYRLETGSFAPGLAQLASVGLIRKDALQNSTTFLYEVESSTADTYLCRATRIGSNAWHGSLTVDDGGTISGAVSNQEGYSIEPAQ